VYESFSDRFASMLGIMDDTAQDFWLAKLGDADRFSRWVFDAIAPSLTGNVLEVGCGVGTFTALIAAAGHDVTAIDINPSYVATARSRLSAQSRVTVVEGDATRMSWAASFDTVVLLDVLEHIEDDVGFLRRLRACLKPGGRLVAKVPAGQWLYSPMDAAIGHFRRYSKKSLRRVLAAADLAAIEQRYFNAAGILGWWLNGRVLKRTTPPQEQIALFEAAVPILRTIESVARPIGLSIIATGERRGR
jgi:2-polyprenyl-3-methyl-5-hydroxy-6-metoxy-1,4-benzoquinol methylase